MPEARELVDFPAKLIGYSCGPGYKGDVCTLMFGKNGVKLGIAYGASLPDPHNLMVGSGKVHRHIPLERVADLRRAGFKVLVALALRRAHARTAAAFIPGYIGPGPAPRGRKTGALVRSPARRRPK
jgi:hypothetical protein